MSLVSAAAIIAGRYRLDYQIATDRFAEVWHASDVELARPVAVKLLSADAADADSVMQFRAAAYRGASLTHEGLVRVFDYCEPEPSNSVQQPFVVMEFVDGQPLTRQLHAGPLGAARTVDMIAQVTAALQAVHRAGLTHGDIRPEKILLGRGGAVKIVGLSGTSAAGSAAIGADLRALGIIARECLGEPEPPGGSSALSGTLAASVAELVAELCVHPSVDGADITAHIAAIADRAGSLRAQLCQPAADRRGAVPTPTQPSPRLRAALHTRRPDMTRGSLASVGISAIIAVTIAAAAIFGALALNSSAPPAEGAGKAAPVRVTAASLIGMPVNVVRLQLRRHGLIVRIRWRNSDRVSAGDVIAVRPVGLVPAHSVVVIVVSSGPIATGAGPGGRHARTQHRHRNPPPQSPTPTRSPSSSSSPTPTPSPSPSSSPAA